MNDLTHQPILANQPPASASIATESTGGVTGGKRRAADRLNIPSSVVRASGFTPGDKAYVVDDDPAGAAVKPCLVLLKLQPPAALADYVVAKDCRIRVTPAMLKKCGLEGHNFEIDGSDGKIIVKLR